MNYSIKLNLSALKNAGIVTIKGKSGAKKCVVIPIEDNEIYCGEKGTYLSLTAIALQEPKFDDTHLVKHSLSREAYQALTEEERNAIPITGGMKPLIKAAKDVEAPEVEIADDIDDGLPF